MTAIAAVVTKTGAIWIGGDSAGVRSLELEIRKDPKVFKKGKFIFGFTTSFRMGNILHYKFKIPEHPKGISVDRYMNTVFIDAVKECFIENDYGSKDHGGEFIVGYKERLFIIGGDFQVGMPLKRYTATGCGHDICKGSLHATEALDLGADVRIKMALKAAEEFSGGVRKPFVIKHMYPEDYIG